MYIIRIDSYLDGGTFEVSTSDGKYCIDNRLGTTTKGKIFDCYPDKFNTNICKNQEELKLEICKELERKILEIKSLQELLNC